MGKAGMAGKGRDMSKTNEFHLRTARKMDGETVTRALRAAGVDADVTADEERFAHGLIVSETLARDAWNHDTGANDCEGRCAPGTQHMTWDSLNEGQRAAYRRAMAEFMKKAQYDQMIAKEVIEVAVMDSTFPSVALEMDQTARERKA